MDSSSSASSSSISLYTGALSFSASGGGGGARLPDLPIYESTPHYPPMDNFNGRLVPNSSSPYLNYGYDYANYNYARGRGGDGGGGSTADSVAERREDDEGGAAAAMEREHMFDKVVTPSDVGKLNRLVIPKQHAEKYFPLDSNTGDSKGLLLNFEDRTGKSWRFRYSYWNSSQSYVMTKGWSRFVKEKKLDAGDVVSFHRGVGDLSAKEHFYIDWRRRRPDAPPSSHHHYPLYRGFHSHQAVDAVRFQHGFSLHRPIHPPYYLAPPFPTPQLHQARDLHHHRGSVVSYNGVTTNNSTTGCYGGNYGMMSPNFCHQTGSVVYLGSAAPPPHQRIPVQASSQRDMAMVFESVPVVVHGTEKAASKRLRLFGVNMDCTDADDEPNHHHNQNQNQNQSDLVLDSDRVSSSSGESGLQLRLSGVDKGKSSMSLDLDI